MTAYDDIHAHLTNIGVPGEPNGMLHHRLYPVLDRLMLRPENEPDTADLIGEINERCDRADVPNIDTAARVEWLANTNRYLKEKNFKLLLERAQRDDGKGSDELVKTAVRTLVGQKDSITSDVQTLAIAVLKDRLL